LAISKPYKTNERSGKYSIDTLTDKPNISKAAPIGNNGANVTSFLENRKALIKRIIAMIATNIETSPTHLVTVNNATNKAKLIRMILIEKIHLRLFSVAMIDFL